MWSRWCVFAALGSVLASGAAFGAPPRPITLDYQRGDGAGSCPEEESLRAGVAGRLGYDPFTSTAERHVAASVSGAGAGLQARIALTDDARGTSAERRLTSSQTDCSELAATMALAIAMAIDPLVSTRPAPAATVAEPPPVEVKESPAVIPIVVEVERAPPAPVVRQAGIPVRAYAAAGAVGTAGMSPGAAYGATLELGARRAALSLGVAGWVDFTRSESLRVGKMETSAILGALVPCWHRGIFAGCALLLGGALRASGVGLVDARQVSTSLFAAGGRLALQVPFGSLWMVAAHADVVAPLTQTVLRVSGEAVWTSPSLAAAVGLGVGVLFP